MIRCAMFDFGNVLGIFDTPHWYEFVKRYKGNCLSPEELFFGFGVNLIRAYDISGLSDTEFYSKVRLLYRMNIPTQKDFFDMFGKILSLDKEMLRVVSSLRNRGVITVLITNMNDFHAGYVRQNFPEVMENFDYKMISCEEGVAKPNPEAWIRPLEWAGLKAEECIFIDDSLDNIEKAFHLGIKGWHYNVTDEKWCMNGKLESERQKFNNFLALLDSRGLLYDKNKTR